MGRWSTGALTTGEVLKIKLSYLIKKGYIQKGCHVSGTLEWTNESNIGIESFYFKDKAYIRLSYTTTCNTTNEVNKLDYKIYLSTVPSNLGKGEVLYFICPFSGRKSRILYKCYGSLYWKSRESYKNRIYYQSQLDPKSMRPFKHLLSDCKLDELYKQKKKSHYRGKPTRIMDRIERLYEKRYLAMLNYKEYEKLLVNW